MDIIFRDKKLRELANDYKKCQKKLGPLRTQRLMQRLGDLRAAQNLKVVKTLPGRFHELAGDRKGQWACDLDHPYRLIFEPVLDRLLDGINIEEIILIEVVNIVDYH